MKLKITLVPHRCMSLKYNYEKPGIIQSCLYKKIGYNKIEQVGGFAACREILINNVVEEIDDVDKNRLRLLLSSTISIITPKANLLPKIKLGIKMANIVSMKYNMQPVLSQVIDTKDPYPIVEVSASKKWQRSPQMLSLFIVFTKYCNTDRFLKVNNYKELMAAIDSDEFIDENLHLDSKKIHRVLSNYTNLFKNLTMETNYKTKAYKSINMDGIQYEGISYLCNGNSDHTVLKKRYAKLLPDK